MRDCTRPEMKDLLPDLLSGAADDATRAHVAECESCARELALLRDVRALSAAPRMDVDRIAGAVPAYRPTPWRRMAHLPLLRVAAVIVLVIGGATLLKNNSHPGVMDTAMVRVAAQETARGVRVPVTDAGNSAQTSTASELAVGDPLTDLSDSDLRTLLQEMREIQAVTPTETDVIVLPALRQGGE